MAKFSDWKQSGLDYRDFQHSDRLEDWESVKHRRGSKSKVCKRNKNKPHNYNKVVKFYQWTNASWYVIECSKCGKQTWVTP